MLPELFASALCINSFDYTVLTSTAAADKAVSPLTEAVILCSGSGLG